MAQPCPQIIEHLIRDVNPKWFHDNKPILAIASGQLDETRATLPARLDYCRQIDMRRCGPDQCRYNVV
jgi:hypothetical protein